jgi:hypothetical protein
MTKEFADVAQLVEQLIRNQQVNGSSPFVGSIISITFGSVDCQLLYNCCTSDLSLQNTHRLLRPSGRSLDVKALGRTHVPVPQDALDRSIFDAELLEVGRETATVNSCSKADFGGASLQPLDFLVLESDRCPSESRADTRL